MLRAGEKGRYLRRSAGARGKAPRLQLLTRAGELPARALPHPVLLGMQVQHVVQPAGALALHVLLRPAGEEAGQVAYTPQVSPGLRLTP